MVIENCKVRFGSVRSDICETCERINVNLAAARRRNEQNDTERLEREKQSHLVQAQSFYDKIGSFKSTPKADTLAICMDFEKNLPLPVTNVGPEYYKRQLWLHNFGIIDVQTGDASMYVYSEHFGRKGPNEVTVAYRVGGGGGGPPRASSL